MPNILIVGATRGLGASLAKQYADKSDHVYATARSDNNPESSSNISYVSGVDMTDKLVGSKIVDKLGKTSLDTVIITGNLIQFAIAFPFILFPRVTLSLIDTICFRHSNFDCRKASLSPQSSCSRLLWNRKLRRTKLGGRGQDVHHILDWTSLRCA